MGWYRHITLSMLAHAVPTALAAQAGNDTKGAAETHQPSFRSPWRRSGGSWRLFCLVPDAIQPGHPRTDMVGLAKTTPGHRPPLPLPKPQLRTRTTAGVLKATPT